MSKLDVDTELEWAMDDGDLAKVRHWLKRGASLTKRGTSSGKTPLSRAATRKSNWAVCKLLLDAGAEVNAKDSDGGTPFLSAVRWSTADVVENLLAHGANPRARTRHGETALAMAQTPQMLRYLFGLGLKPYPGLEQRFLFDPKDLKRRDWKEDAERKVAVLQTLRELWPEGKAAIDKLLRPVEATKKPAPAARSRPLPSEWGKRMKAAIGTRIERRHEKLGDLTRDQLARPEAIAHPSWPELVEQLLNLTALYPDLTEDAYGERLPVSRMDEDGGGVPEMYVDENLHTIDLTLELLAQPHAVAHPRWADLVQRVLAKKVEAVGADMNLADDELAALFEVPEVRKHPKRTALRKAAKKAFRNAEL